MVRPRTARVERFAPEAPYRMARSPETKAKLIAAAKRGVKIIFSTNGPTSTDSLPTESVIIHDWKKLMQEIPGVEIYMDKGPRKVHAKVFVFDHSKSVVGSFNMDSLSDHVNGEVALYVDSKSVAKAIHNDQFVPVRF